MSIKSKGGKSYVGTSLAASGKKLIESMEDLAAQNNLTSENIMIVVTGKDLGTKEPNINFTAMVRVASCAHEHIPQAHALLALRAIIKGFGVSGLTRLKIFIFCVFLSDEKINKYLNKLSGSLVA
jgi:hypothetical protein